MVKRREGRCWSMVCAAVVLMAATWARAAEAPSATGQVWAEAPVQPWDQTVAKGDVWASVLNQEFSLARRGQGGERHRYRFRRQNLALDRQGHVVQRMLFEGTLVRTLQEEKQPGLWAERIQWERFGVGQASGTAEKPVVNDAPGAAGFAFDFYPPTFDYLNPPGDYTKLGDPMVGYFLKVVMMDVTGFDAMLMALRDDPNRKLRIGDTAVSSRWQQGRAIRPGQGAGVGGDYQLGAMTVSVAGITRRDGEPCALLWFAAEGNDVKQEADTPQVKLHMQAREYFRGTLAVSLRDGHVVAGELWGPLLGTLAIGSGGQPLVEQPTAGFLQQVSLWEESSAGRRE